MPGIPIRLTTADATIAGVLDDSPAGRALAGRLPLTAAFRDYQGVEKVAILDDPLPMDGMPQGHQPTAGEIGWFAPYGTLVLYYRGIDYWDGLARLGAVDDAEAVEALGRRAKITIERA